MLQLMLEREQSYGDIASLLGVSEDEVRARARAALTEVAGENPDREVALTDYLLGQADPIGRADVARHLAADPDANALASKLEAKLRLLAPGARLPDLPEERAPKRSRPSSADPVASPGSSPPGSISPRQRRLIAALLAGLAVVAVAALIAAGVFDGGGSDSNAATTTAGPTTASGDQVTKAVLRPTGGSDGKGIALFARVKKVPVIQVSALGLDPLAKGQSYYVWLYKSKKLALRVGGFVVDSKGRAVTQLQVPAEALALVANGTFDQIDVTLTADADYQAALATARRQKSLPALTGTSVMRGKITGPLVGAVPAGKGQGASGGGQGG